ncbi:MAG: hypothetical protein ACRDRK_20105 [Pseudonocardia sp.]
MSPAPHRLLRAVVASAGAMAAGAAAHLIGGGSLSSVGVLAGLTVLLGPAWLATGRERGWAAIAGLQVAGQQVVHVLLEFITGEHGTPAPDDVTLYGHVAAAAVIATWLRCGERHLWVAARRAARSMAAWGRWVLRLCERAPHTFPVIAAAATGAPRICSGAALRHVVTRRGPPLLA